MTSNLRSGLGKKLLASLLMVCFTTSMAAQYNPGLARPSGASQISGTPVSPQTNSASANSETTTRSRTPEKNAAVSLEMAKSRNPLRAYSPSLVPEPQLTNSQLLTQLIRDGKLYLSLKDAIRLALENNLDLAIARYNLPIADTDILRTKAGGVFRGVNAGVVQNPPGGGVGGFGAGAPGAGAGGTTGGAGGAGAGASGLVQSTLGAGTPVQSYDPAIIGTVGAEHQRTPLPNQRTYGVPLLQLNT